MIAGPDPEQLSFVLKENETGEVEVRRHRNMHKFITKLQMLSKRVSASRSVINLLLLFSLLIPQWHAFSVPELQNFLVILQKEEAERIRAVEQKYTVYRKKLQQALQQHTP